MIAQFAHVDYACPIYQLAQKTQYLPENASDTGHILTDSYPAGLCPSNEPSSAASLKIAMFIHKPVDSQSVPSESEETVSRDLIPGVEHGSLLRELDNTHGVPGARKPMYANDAPVTDKNHHRLD